MTDFNDAPRISEAIPRVGKPITDGQLEVICPACQTTWRLNHVDVSFKPGESSYSCPTDQTILGGARRVSPTQLVLDAPHGMSLVMGE